MARVEEESTDSESDSGDDTVLQCRMWRREASDDDSEKSEREKEGKESERRVRSSLIVGVGSDDESDGLVGVDGEYDDDEEELEVFEENDEEEEVAEGTGDFGEEEQCEDSDVKVKVEEAVVDRQRKAEKKTNEDALVEPRIGEFYMHDDRYRGDSRSRQRQFGGKRLRELKDEKKWRHDKFEEMTLLERSNEESQVRRNFGGNDQGCQKIQGRGRNNQGRLMGQGRCCGYVRANKLKPRDSTDIQFQSSKTVRGKGRVKYKPIFRSHYANPPTNDNQPRNTPGMTLKADSAWVFARTSNVDSNSPTSMKRAPTSCKTSALHSISPASLSSCECSVTKVNVIQPRSTNREVSAAPVPQTQEFLLRNIVNDSIAREKLYVNESIHRLAGNYATSMPLQSSMTWPAFNAECTMSRGKGRGSLPSAPLKQQSSPRQVNRVSQMAQSPAIQQMPVESVVQLPLQVNARNRGPYSWSGSQALFKALPSVISEPRMSEALPQSTGFGKQSSIVHGSTVTSFPFGGIIGDQNFTANPEFLPGHNPQARLGYGISDMTWISAMPGAGGAIGAAYPLPYVAVNSGYNAYFSHEMPSIGVASITVGTGKPSNDIEPSDGTELVNKHFGQQQIKPIRYSKMNFNQ